VVIGGLFSSTILTLVIVPVLYRLVEGRKERKAKKKLAKAEKKTAAKAPAAKKPATKATPKRKTTAKTA
jgi:HAE1 family hydrophobic/amphiphilic exporter-1